MILRSMPLGPLQANCFIVGCEETRQAAAIDPGGDAHRILASLEKDNLKLSLILNTHGHFDHTHGNVHYARLFGVRIAAHAAEAPLYADDPDGQCGKPDVLLEEQLLAVGTITVQVYHTPRHTPGSACFLIGPFLVSGDSLFADGIGRLSADEGRSYREKREGLVQALTRIVRPLPPETQVLPGHGQTCTLAPAREMNPALRGD